MTDEPALLAAIHAHPDEDTPRLAYADWLDEHDRPERAAFIRLQCDPARSADDPDEAEFLVAELEERHRTQWLAGLPRFPWVTWEFRRGFPEIVIAPGDLFLERYESFAHLPGLRSVCLDRMENALVRDLASRPWNPGWVELELQEDPMAGIGSWGYESTPAFVAIARCEQARQLRRLQFSLFTLTTIAARELAESPHLEHLEELHLEGDPASSWFAALRVRFGDRLVVDRD
jgi:uncharacterized protein (TIGR02996 family)